MDRAYWNALEHTYPKAVFSVLDHDTAGRIAGRIQALAGAGRTAADFGCGPGQMTALLRHAFARVEACDWSPALLDQAQARLAEDPKVRFHHFDLAGTEASPFAPVDLGLCSNVLIMPSAEARERIWNRLAELIAPAGTLLLIVPSHESALFTGFRRMDWNLRAGVPGGEAEDRSLETTAGSAAREQGVRFIDGVPTKHFLREELRVHLGDRGFSSVEFTKLPYPWTTEFDNPPDWMAEPLPWHWLVEARR